MSTEIIMREFPILTDRGWVKVGAMNREKAEKLVESDGYRVTTFDEWKALVDNQVWLKVGVGCDDLPDIDYRLLYESGTPPESAADHAIWYAGQT